MFLAVVRCIGRPKVLSAVIHSEPQGLIEKRKRELMKSSGPKKEFLSVKDREEEILERVQQNFEGNYMKSWMNTSMYFWRNCPKVDLPRGRLSTLLRQTLRHSPK